MCLILYEVYGYLMFNKITGKKFPNLNNFKKIEFRLAKSNNYGLYYKI